MKRSFYNSAIVFFIFYVPIFLFWGDFYVFLLASLFYVALTFRRLFYFEKNEAFCCFCPFLPAVKINSIELVDGKLFINGSSRVLYMLESKKNIEKMAKEIAIFLNSRP
ncbi:hypothetical protein [Pseudoalteromonas maricaloris]|uniref:hypothetical protein n=1 Tax=Pseudoalteromonas maricaloris TaxID=184924 RepID=UPI00029AE40C|nr:hypothetical protein [Pseudoalteromonas flavipulchra]